MKRTAEILACALLLSLASGCRFFSELIHDDEVVAELGRNRLYRSQLESYIPKGVSPEDSAAMASQYITTWARELLFVEVAQERLSKSESDVSKELEDYRKSLLKFRYEQHYVEDRLDTTVTNAEIESYYESHKELFILDVPVVKARFLDMMPDSPNYKEIRRKMSSDEYADLAAADSLSKVSAIRYEDRSDEWVSMIAYARNFSLDYGTVLSKLKGDGFIEIKDDRGDIKLGYVVKILRAGTLAPLEYCEQRVRDIIISNRKRDLLTTLEQDLLNDALAREQLIIY